MTSSREVSRRVSPVATSRRWIWRRSFPPTSRKNTSRSSSTGDHAKPLTGSFPNVSCTGHPPALSSIQTWFCPVIAVRNASFRPDAENAGVSAERMLR